MATGPLVPKRWVSALMAPVSSILLLVVVAAPPPSSVTWPSGVATIAPQPPGPGLPFDAPSVNTTIGCTGIVFAARLSRAFFEVGVAVEARFVEAQQPPGGLVVQAAASHRRFDVEAQLCRERFAVEFDVVQHLANRVALDHGIEHDRVIVSEADVHRVGVAEQVM